MYSFSLIQDFVTRIRSEFGEVPDTAINILLTVALESGVTVPGLMSKLGVSHDEALYNIGILMALRMPNDNSIALMSLNQDESLSMTCSVEKLTAEMG